MHGDTIRVEMMSALAQPTRMRVVTALARVFPGRMAVGDIARLAETPQSTMSSHLAILSRAGHVAAYRTGRVIEYGLRENSLPTLAGFLLSRAPTERRLPHATSANGEGDTVCLRGGS